MESNHIVYCPRCHSATPAENNFCSKCGAPLSSDVLRPPFNPYPPMHHPQPPRPIAPPKKSLKWWQILLIVMGSVALGLYIFGRIGTMILMASGNTKTGYRITASSGTGPRYNINQTRTAKDGAQITIRDVGRSSGTGFIRPKFGSEFLIVTIEVSNQGNSDFDFGYIFFRMQDGEKYIQTPENTSINKDTQLPSGVLKPGDHVTGTLVFEEHTGSKGLTLLYWKNVTFGDPDLEFQLN